VVPIEVRILELNDPDPDVRSRACEFLMDEHERFMWQFILAQYPWYDLKLHEKIESSRRRIKDMMPHLMKSLQSEDETVKTTAAFVLAYIGSDASSACPTLRKMFNNRKADFDTRYVALQALLFVTPENQPVGPLVLEQLKSVSPETVKEFEDEWTELTKLFDSGTPSSKANIAISGMDFDIGFELMLAGRTTVEVPSILKATSKEYPTFVRANAILLLRGMGQDAVKALPTLREIMNDDGNHSLIRYMAASVIFEMDPRPGVVAEAIKALALQGKEKEEFVKLAREHFEMMKSQRGDWKEFAAIWAESVPRFVLLLQFPRAAHRRYAIRILRDIGPAAKSAVPELQKMLNDPDEDVRTLAAKALNVITAKPPKK